MDARRASISKVVQLPTAAEEQIELRCGDASISSKMDGKRVIRGTYVEAQARGTNRIKGGSVQID